MLNDEPEDDDAVSAFTMPPLTPEEIWSSFEPPKSSCDSPTDVAGQFNVEKSGFDDKVSFGKDDDPPLTMLEDTVEEDDETLSSRRNHLYLLEESFTPVSLSFAEASASDRGSASF